MNRFHLSPLLRWTLVLLAMFALVSPAAAELREYGLWWTPEPATKGAHHVDNLFVFIFWLTAIVFVATQAVYIWFLIKYRRKRGVPAHYSHGNNRLEILWTVIPAAVFLALVVWSNRIWYRELRAPAPADSIQLDLVSYQYGWHVRNPGSDGKLGAYKAQLTAKENWFGTEPNDETGRDDYQSEGILTVPVGRPVQILLRSLDVIHAFYVPEFRMYQDAIPGRMIDWVWFEATRTGNFELACSQLCGSGHYNMKAKINVVSQEEYDKFVREKSRAAALEFEKKKAAQAVPPAAPAATAEAISSSPAPAVAAR